MNISAVEYRQAFLNLVHVKEYVSMPRAKTPRNGNSQKQTAGANRGATAAEAAGISTSNDLESEIRRRAYELYERRGCTPGHEKEDWLVAEQEIAIRHHQGA